MSDEHIKLSMEPTRSHEQQQIAFASDHACSERRTTGGPASNTCRSIDRSQGGRDGQRDTGHRGREAHGRCGGAAVLLRVGLVGRVVTHRRVGGGHVGRVRRGRGRGVRGRFGLLLLLAGGLGGGSGRGGLGSRSRSGHVGGRSGRRRGGRRAAEELGREQHLVDREDDRRGVVEHGGRDAGLVLAGVQRYVVAAGDDGEVVLARAGGGQGLDVALGGLERGLGSVLRQRVVLQERDEVGAGELAQIGEVLGLEGVVVGGEQRERLVHGRLVCLDDPGRDDEARELLAAGLLEEVGEVDGGGGRGAEEAREGDGVGDLEDGEGGGLLIDALGVGGLELGAWRGGGEPDLAAAEVGDVDVAHVAGGLAGLLVEGGGELGAGVEGVQLLLVEVVEEGEEAERVLDVGEGEVGDERGHGAVGEHEDGHRVLAVDLVAHLGLGEVAVVQRVLRPPVEDRRDVVGGVGGGGGGGEGRGGEGEEEEEGEVAAAVVDGGGHGAAVAVLVG
ncbi:unnamed protein product [Urochloa decumbens]|uniref:Uncharacterized protein n=1 Tax=Urochloa decumbens TaxID=240449 RepID=A0ABC9F4K7_9POAL